MQTSSTRVRQVGRVIGQVASGSPLVHSRFPLVCGVWARGPHPWIS